MRNNGQPNKAFRRGGLVLMVAISVCTPAAANRAAAEDRAYQGEAALQQLAAAAQIRSGRTLAAGEPGILLRVNGEPVTVADYERMRGVLTQQGLQGGELESRALRNLVHHRLILQEAGRRNIRVADQDLDAALVSLRERFRDLGSFGAWMQDQDLDDRSLMQALREGILAARVRAVLVEDVHVSDKQIEAYYAAHRDELKTEDVWLQVIAVRERETAREIQAALGQGEDFGRLARQRSLGRRAAQGGDLGWVSSEHLRTPLRRALTTLQPGEAIGPLQLGEEFLVVRLHQRRPGRTKSLDEARPAIEPRLLSARQEETLQAWLAQQEAQAGIERVMRPEPGSRSGDGHTGNGQAGKYSPGRQGEQQ